MSSYAVDRHSCEDSVMPATFSAVCAETDAVRKALSEGATQVSA